LGVGEIDVAVQASDPAAKLLTVIVGVPWMIRLVELSVATPPPKSMVVLPEIVMVPKLNVPAEASESVPPDRVRLVVFAAKPVPDSASMPEETEKFPLVGTVPLKLRVPPETVVPPEKLFVPLRFRVPAETVVPPV
jgi:hypothetical protein